MKIARSRGLGYDPFEAAARPLPGTRPVVDDPWLTIRDDYSTQMAERDRLLADRPDAVLALRPDGRPAAEEVLAQITAALIPALGFRRDGDAIRRPDGHTIRIDPATPLATLGRLLPADLCLLQKQGDEHVLTGAVLCFPSAWMLSEKIGRPLANIHRPVPGYAPVARRVQRLFDGVRVGQPLWRANLLRHETDALHAPRSEAAPARPAAAARFLRSERQILWRLPRTGDVVFAIETHIWPAEGEA